jgi:hypothetical protein
MSHSERHPTPRPLIAISLLGLLAAAIDVTMTASMVPTGLAREGMPIARVLINSAGIAGWAIAYTLGLAALIWTQRTQFAGRAAWLTAAPYAIIIANLGLITWRTAAGGLLDAIVLSPFAAAPLLAGLLWLPE